LSIKKRPVLTGLFLCILSLSLSAQQDKMRIAIMDLTANSVSPETAKTVSDLLRTELFNTGLFTVIERAEMDKILKEQGFQQSGCTENECVVQFGKILSAKKVLVGTVNKLGNTYIINARIVDVEKAVTEFADNTVVKAESQLYSGCKVFARKLSQRIAGLNLTIKSVKASSTQAKDDWKGATNYEPVAIQNMLDDNPNTWWSSEFTDNQRVLIELEKECEPSKLEIQWETAYAKSYKVFISRNQTVWKQVYSTDNGEGGTDEIDLGKRKTRFIRLELLKRATQWGFAIRDLRVFNE
jgi:TolB-like protein